jgi:hypothetical protein
VLTLDTAVQHYLEEVLGIPAPELRPWARESECGRLPVSRFFAAPVFTMSQTA